MTVRQRQNLLQYLGCYTGPVDGIWGKESSAAAKAFREDYGLGADAGEAALEKMLLDAVAGTAVKTETTGQGESWWKEIKHFAREEFRCKCGGQFCSGYPARMQEAVVKIADAAREHFGRPAHVVSGLRCPGWNAHEGGVANSQHMYGEAIDLRIDGVDAESLRRFVSRQPGHRYSYCINSTNVHFDIEKTGR